MVTHMPEGKQEKKTTGESSSSDAPLRQLHEVYSKHTNSLQDACLTAQARVGEAERNHLQSVNEVHIELQKQLQDSCQRYAKALEATAGNENAAELAVQAHREYAEEVNSAHVSARNKLEEIDRSHRDKLESARADYAKSQENSYRSLAKELQGALTRVDPENLDPQQINLLSHILLATSQVVKQRGTVT
jgi:catalase